MTTKTQTLIYRVEFELTPAVCRLIDDNAPAEEIAAARAKRDAVIAEIRSRRDGRRYDKGYN